MPKVVRRGREFWSGLVEEFEKGGAAERHEEFAGRHGVLCDTFRRWLYLLRAEKRGRRWRVPKHKGGAAARMPWPLIEVEAAAGADSRFEIELGQGRRVRVPVGFDAEALRRLLAIFDEKPAP